MDPLPLILFVQTAHSAEDDRVRWHQIPTLEKAGFRTAVISTLGQQESLAATLGWAPSEKRDMIREAIRKEMPAVAVCDTPYAVLAARDAGVSRIIYDVTEWYPSKKNLRDKAIIVPLKRLAMEQLQAKACRACSAFIFGEPEKGKPIKARWPGKPHILLPYYPREDYVPYREPRSAFEDGTFRLFYAGPATLEKGFFNTLAVARQVAAKRPDMHIILTIVSQSEQPALAKLPDNLLLDWHHYLSFPAFCRILQEQDYFLDLRDNDPENTLCLPIKLFYYLAAGRPMAYSDLKAIREYVTSSSDYITLAEPMDFGIFSDAICRFIDDPDGYAASGRAARERYLRDFRWEQVEDRLVTLVRSLAE